MVGENSTLQLVQVSGGKLHAAPGAVAILIIAPLEIYMRNKLREEPSFFFFIVRVFILLSINFLSSSEGCMCLAKWEDRKLKSKEHSDVKKLSF